MTCNPAVPTNSDNSLRKMKKRKRRKKEIEERQKERKREREIFKREIVRKMKDIHYTYINDETSAIRCKMPISIQINNNKGYTPYRTY